MIGDKATHAYCQNCEDITPIEYEELNGLSANGLYLGGNIICMECEEPLLTLYKDRVQ